MSERIREIYRKKGVKPPDGKGIHTEKFHDIATSIKRDNPSYPMSRCYAIAMGKLGASKAVKKSHRRGGRKAAKAIIKKSRKNR